MAGVNVGKVKTKELDEGGARTIVEVRARRAVRADPEGHARDPAPEDAARRDLPRAHARATRRGRHARRRRPARERPGRGHRRARRDLHRLRPGHPPGVQGVDQGARRRDQGRPRRGPERRVRQLRGLRGRRREAHAGARRAGRRRAPARQEHRRRVRGASTSASGALRELIVNSKRTFEATASRDEALAETFAIFPTFLDESKATMARLEDFSRDTRPLVNDLKGPADDLGPTVRDLGDLAPDLEKLFRDLGPLIRAGRTGVPGARPHARRRPSRSSRRCTRSSRSSTRSCRTSTSTRRRSPASSPTAAPTSAADYGTGQRGQTQIGILSEKRNFESYPCGEAPPDWARGNAYLQPNALMRALVLGGIESYNVPRRASASTRRTRSSPARTTTTSAPRASRCRRRSTTASSSRCRSGASRRCAITPSAPRATRPRGTPTRTTDARHTSAVCRSSSSARTGGWEGAYFVLYVAVRVLLGVRRLPGDRRAVRALHGRRPAASSG